MLEREETLAGIVSVLSPIKKTRSVTLCVKRGLWNFQ